MEKGCSKSNRVIDGAWDEKVSLSLSLVSVVTRPRRPSTLLEATFHRTGEKSFLPDKTSFKQTCEEKAASPSDK